MRIRIAGRGEHYQHDHDPPPLIITLLGEVQWALVTLVFSTCYHSPMKALVLNTIKSPLDVEERDDLVAGPGQVVVTLKAAALNRRDFWITQGMYPGVTTPVIPGSDGAGIVSSVGEGVADDWVGKQVILNPGMAWDAPDGTRSARAQDSGFRILGMPDDGTFAEQVAIDLEYVHEKPEHLDWHQAAALPLAALTAYRAVFVQGQLKSGQSVLVSGIGGGVATFALQFAVQAGADVVVTSSSFEKIVRAEELGAVAGFDYTRPDWHKALAKEQGARQLIIDSAGGEGYASLVEVADFGGRIVNYGSTTGSPGSLDMFSVFWKQLGEKKIVPAMDEVFPLEEANAALDRMKNSQQFGKIVLAIAS